MDVVARVLLKVAAKVLEIKTLLKLRFLDCISKAKKEHCDEEDWSASDTCRIITPCSSTFHLEVGAAASLKVATKACFGGKETLKIKISRLLF